jgi:hypothetical protein
MHGSGPNMAKMKEGITRRALEEENRRGCSLSGLGKAFSIFVFNTTSLSHEIAPVRLNFPSSKN